MIVSANFLKSKRGTAQVFYVTSLRSMNDYVIFTGFFPIDENNSTHSKRKKHQHNTAHHEHTFGNVVEFSTASQIVTENGKSKIIINLCGRSLFPPSQWRAVLELYVGG